jgi:hypothetical protein
MCSSSSDFTTEKFSIRIKQPVIGAYLAEWDVMYASSEWKHPNVGGAAANVEGATPNVGGATAIVGRAELRSDDEQRQGTGIISTRRHHSTVRRL